MSNQKPMIMPVGKYAGKTIESLPNHYLRWLITQKFPKAIVDAAIEKLKSSDYNDIYLSVSRHAIDMYSKRFLFRWMKKENIRGEEGNGIATHVAEEAEIAWEKGEDVSKNRYAGDGVVKLYDGILWVFNVNPDHPDYKDVVTVMENT